MNAINICPTCKKKHTEKPDICTDCGYPLSGTQKQKSHFVAHQLLMKERLEKTKNSVRNSRIILFSIAGFNSIVPIVFYISGEFGSLLFLLHLSMGLLFLFFAFLSKKAPFISILIPTIVLMTFYFLVGFLLKEGITLGGLIWKSIIFGALFYSLTNIAEANKIKRKNKHLFNG